MEKRPLGKSNLYVTRIGLGCMSLGTDEAKAAKIIDTAFDAGINYFDTADLYDYGINEEIVGKTLKNRRDQVIIATKVGNRWTSGKSGWTWDPSKTYIKEAVKQSLKRLQTDYIDLYQLHGGTIDDPIDETIEAFEELKEEGLIRYYGISSIRPNVVRQYAEKSNIVSCMVQYSLFDRRPEEEILPLLHKKGISAIARTSLAKGLLSEKNFEKASSAMIESGYLDYSYEELKEAYYSLKEKIKGRKMNEIALQYALANPAAATVIAGASSPEQLQENIEAVQSAPLSKEEIALIQSLTKANKYTDHR